MLISHDRRFVFIHIYRNAGTSITAALLPFAVHPVQQKVSALLRRVGIAAGAQPYPGHVSAAELVARMGQTNFDCYFSFAFVRNPWDWQVSLYNYICQNPKHYQYNEVRALGGFEQYLGWRVQTDHLALQKGFVCVPDSDDILVDYIGRFENLECDFKTICARIGVSAQLPRLNVSNERPYQDYYTPATVELVREAFAPDISLFNYEFA